MNSKELPLLILDEGISFEALQNAIRTAGVPCEMLIHHFPRGTPDAEWLPLIGEKGWILLCKDRRIAKNTIEYNALITARVGAFFLVSANISGEQIVQCVTAAIPRMLQLIRSEQKPFLAKVYKDGKVRLWEEPQKRQR